MLDTWGKFNFPNNQLIDWLFPTSWRHWYFYHTVLEKHFWSRGFLHQWGACAQSLCHKGYNSHKANHRFSAAWTLLCLPGMMPTLNIFPLLLTHNTPACSDHSLKHPPLSPQDFLYDNSLITWEAGRDSSTPSLVETWLRPLCFLSKDRDILESWYLHQKFLKLHILSLFCFSD